MKQLAIMRDVGYGCRDVGHPVLFFNTYISEGEAALQILGGTDAYNLIADSSVYDVKNLEGKACWVDVEDNLIKFVSFCRIGENG